MSPFTLFQKNIFTLLLLLFSDPALGRCYRCMVIYEKHFNVLQYKESKLRLFGHLGQVNRCVLTTSMSTANADEQSKYCIVFFRLL